MKTKLLITLMLVFATLTSFSQVFTKPGAGVTILVHGWNPDGSQPAWMDKMADAIIARSGGNGIKATITVTGSKGALIATCSNWNYDLTTSTSAEIVVLVNWTAVSDHLTKGVTAQEVAAAVAPKIYQSQNSKPALSELPIHLIGHSRGGGMVFEIARLLGLQGVEVDHVTALDPHPLTATDPQGAAQPIGPGSTIDTPIKIYDNILFADNYWQNIAYPKGQTITGAYNRLWTSLPGGYHNEIGYTYNILGTSYNFSDHLNTILAYHGTINLATPANNGQSTMTSTERAWFNTYENAGQKSGFVYSLDIAGDRKSADTPNSGDAIIAGYHNNTSLGGSGARVAIDWSGSVWPNVYNFKMNLNTNALTVGNTYSIGGADQLQFINTTYNSYSKDCTFKIYFDTDRNPYNGTFLQDDTYSNSLTGSTIQTLNASFSPTSLMDANYYTLLEINDGTNKRYIYAPYQFYLNCEASINDTNFQTALLAIPGLDANSDGAIQCSEAAAWTGEIDVSGKSISSLTGIEGFTNITKLNCSNNQLTSIDLTANTALKRIECNNNLLTELNVTGLTSLDSLYMNSNKFIKVNLSTNTALVYLRTEGNSLTGLELTNNTNLKYINCSNNALQYLNLKNGNNTIVSYFDARTNSKLTCIEVDNVSYSTTNWTNKDAGASYNTICPACEVTIPDANFKAALLNISGLDINGDGKIQCYEAAAINGSLDVSSRSISDLTGIEAFTNITELYCGENSLTSINLTSNTALTKIYCSVNQLTTLNVSANKALTELFCGNNLLSDINVSGLSSLLLIDCSNNKFSSLNFTGIGLSSISEIYCSDNLLTSITVSGITTLTKLDCNNNNLTSINFAGLTSLTNFKCSNNKFASLDVTSATALEYLQCKNNLLNNLNTTGLDKLTDIYCNDNQLATLNFTTNQTLNYLECENNLLTSLNVGGLICFGYIDCSFNKLSGLNFSTNTSLSTIYCQTNLLTSLNVKNGNNSNFNDFNATNNTDLTCIQVDDVALSTTNWTNIDAGASYNTSCGMVTETSGIGKTAWSVYPNPVSDILIIEAENLNENASFEIINSVGQVVSAGTLLAETSIQTSHFPMGIYLLKVENGKTSEIRKIVKK
jgi:Leucine-rich repeat (LRR) protein